MDHLWQLCSDVIITLLTIAIDGGRGYRDYVSLTTWVRLVKATKIQLAEWEAYQYGLANLGFTSDFVPYQQATTNVQLLREYLRDLEGDDQ